MVQPNWALAGGQSFDNALSMGLQLGQMVRQREQEAERKNALTAYATKPGPESLAGVIKADPETGLRLQEQDRASALKAAEQNRDHYRVGAQIIRQMNPQDQAGWEQALAVARQAGVPVEQLGVPVEFNPQYRDSVIAVAQALDPQKENENPSNVQEYEYAKAQGFGGSYMDFLETKRGPIVANNGDGTFTIIPRSGVQAAPQGNIPPPPPGFVLDNDGGPAPSAPGTFQP